MDTLVTALVAILTSGAVLGLVYKIAQLIFAWKIVNRQGSTNGTQDAAILLLAMRGKTHPELEQEPRPDGPGAARAPRTRKRRRRARRRSGQDP